MTDDTRNDNTGSKEPNASPTLDEQLDALWKVYDINPLPTLMLSRDGRILEANSAMKELTGYVIGENGDESENGDETDIYHFITRLAPNERYARRVERIARKILEGKVEMHCYQGTIITKTGERRVIEFTVFDPNYTNASLDVTMVQGIDITDSRQIEEGLKQLTSAIEQSSEGVLLFDLDGNIQFTNRAFAAMHGFTQNELIDCHISIFHSPEQIPALDRSISTARLKGEYQGELWHIQRDGSAFPTLTHTTLLRDDAGDKTGFLTTCRNITNEKRIENQRRALRKLRNAVLDMTDVNDIFSVLSVLRECLEESTINYSNAEINIIETLDDPTVMKSYHLSGDMTWTKTTNMSYINNVVSFWEKKTPVYRRDFEKDDTYDERNAIVNTWGPVRSVIDVPFSHGTLALNSERPNAFSPDDMRYLKEMTEILTEGFQRTEDFQKLAFSESRYRTLVESPANVVVILMGREGHFLYISPQIKALTGYAPEHVYRDKTIIRRLIHPEDIKGGRHITYAALRGKTVKSHVLRWMDKIGTWNWAEITAIPINGADASVKSVQFILRDITEQKLAEDALRASEAKNKSILNAIPDIMIVLSREGVILDYNGAREHFYVPPEKFINKHISEILPKDIAEKTLRHIERLYEGATQVYDYQLDMNGDTRSFETRMVKHTDDEVLTIIRDISLTKKRDAQRRALQQLRKTVLNMNGTDDLYQVLETLEEHIREAGISFDNGCINFIEDFETPLIKCYSLAKKKYWRTPVLDKALKAVMKFWNDGEVVYRSNLEKNDQYDEKKYIDELWGQIKSVVDIPFSHGTLALNSVNADAFSKDDIHFLHDIAQVLSEGFKRAEDLEQIAISEARYRILVESPKNRIVSLLGLDGHFIYISPQVESLTGYSPEEFLANASLIEHIVSEKDYPAVKKVYEKAVAGEPTANIETMFIHREGSVFWAAVMVLPVTGYSGDIEAIQLIIHDISDLKQAEHALKESEERYQELYNYSPDMYFTIMEDGTIDSVNQFGADYLGYTKDELIGKSVENIVYPEDVEKVRSTLREIFAKHLPDKEHEFRKVKKDGTVIWVHELTSLVTHADDHRLHLHVTCRDISERILAEERLQKSLEEKEILLKEIHHRVKNNMQVISSLLSLQMDRIEEEQYGAMFRESINRIQTMALIHELLYRSENFTSIDFNEYITRICNHLSVLFSAKAGSVGIDIKVRDISLRLDTAIPCGLIINELVSNALKYAFEPKESGTIEIEMYRSSESEVSLTVSDNGRGINEDFDWRNAGTLGLKMVTLLSEGQLGGTIERLDREGTVFHITFED